MEQKIQELLNKKREKGEQIILDIGCGNMKRGTIGIDHFPGPFVDIVMDFNKGIFFPDNSVDGIIMYHSLEHVVDPIFVLKECRRILKEGGMLDIKVPHHSNISAYQIHHKSYWNYFSLDPVVSEGKKSNEQQKIFSLISRELNLVKFKFLNKFFSKYSFLYEMYFYHIFPCYEIRFLLKK